MHSAHTTSLSGSFMPLLVAFGAAGEGVKGMVIHHSWSGDMGMDVSVLRIFN